MLLWKEAYFCWWDTGVINKALNAEAKQQSTGRNNQRNAESIKMFKRKGSSLCFQCSLGLGKGNVIS